MDQISDKLIFTIIIPVWPEDERPFGLDYIDRLEFPKNRYEVICARGFSPCKQRNEAVKVAKGDVLIFFDDDSCPEPDYLTRLEKLYTDKQTQGAGGPNPGLENNKYIPNLVEAVFHSRIAVFSKVKRYKPTGKLRQAGDSDLIFCNFSIRRQLYLDLNGLDERLCPNEENEFFERLYNKYPDIKILYEPGLIACEPRPDTLKAFLQKMYGYGRGRARQFKISPSLWSGLHIMGCLAIIMPVLLFMFSGLKGLLYLLLPYIFLLLTASIFCLISKKRLDLALGLPPAILATHTAYVSGMLKGLIYPVKISQKANTLIKLDYYN